VRAVDLALYADALAGEAAALSARAERARSRLRQSAIEREACAALPRETVDRLRNAGVLWAGDGRGARDELASLTEALRAVEELQAWVEARLAEAEMTAETTRA
jgi:hypothetical protein